MASRVKGSTRIRRLLKEMPEGVRAEIVEAFERSGRRIQAVMRARAKHKTGKLQAGVKYQVLPKSLRLRVGLLGTPRGRAKLFYGFILDKGRAAQTVFVRRFKKGAKREYTSGGKKTGSNIVSYRLRVKKLSGDHFVTGQMPDLRNTVRREAGGVFDRALTRIGGGGSE